MSMSRRRKEVALSQHCCVRSLSAHRLSPLHGGTQPQLRTTFTHARTEDALTQGAPLPTAHIFLAVAPPHSTTHKLSASHCGQCLGPLLL